MRPESTHILNDDLVRLCLGQEGLSVNSDLSLDQIGSKRASVRASPRRVELSREEDLTSPAGAAGTWSAPALVAAVAFGFRFFLGLGS